MNIKPSHPGRINVSTESQNIKNKLYNHIELAVNASSLSEICQLVSLRQLKDFLKMKIAENTNYVKLRSCFLRTSSIEDILPEDILREIISFDVNRTYTITSKTFLKFYKFHIKRFMFHQQEIYNIYTYRDYEWHYPYKKIISKAIIVCEYESQLLNSDWYPGKLSRRKVCQDLQAAVDIAIEGDTIYVYPGIYGKCNDCIDDDCGTCTYPFSDGVDVNRHVSKFISDEDANHFGSLLNINKRVSIIGFGEDDVMLKYSDIRIDGNVFLKNVSINVHHGMWIMGNQQLTMQKCTIRHMRWGIFAFEASTVDVAGCKFIGLDRSLAAIYLGEDSAEYVFIYHCSFTMSGKDLTTKMPTILMDHMHNKDILDIINNTFYHNHGIPYGKFRDHPPVTLKNRNPPSMEWWMGQRMQNNLIKDYNLSSYSSDYIQIQ